MKKILPLVVLGLMVVGSAQAASVNVLGGLTMQNPNSDATGTTYSSSSALTVGATLDFGFVPGFGLETGLISVGEKFKDTTLGIQSDVKTRAWEIPLLLRFTALPVLDFGAGVYFQKFNGTFDRTTGGLSTTGNSWSGAGLKQNDFGAKLSARLMLPIAPMAHFILDASYKLGLTNLSTAGTNFKSRETALLAGIGFGF